MQIPDSYRRNIAQTFFDQTVSILGQTTSVEADGAVNRTEGDVTGTFKGNVRETNFSQFQKDFGLDMKIDVTISCNTDVTVAIGNCLSVSGRKYEVTQVLHLNSHLMIVGVKWRVA